MIPAPDLKPIWHSILGFGWRALGGCLLASLIHSAQAEGPRFELSLKAGLGSAATSGRLFVVASKSSQPEPRTEVARTDRRAPFAVALDVKDLKAGALPVLLDATTSAFPHAAFAELPEGDYYVQALLEWNRDILLPDAPGNFFSPVKKVHLDPKSVASVALELSQAIPEEQLPAETELVKYVKFESPLLTSFYGRPMFLRAGIILPRDFSKNPDRKYPLYVRIGGFASRYSLVSRLMGSTGSGFRQIWMADETPRMIMIHLDGAGPLGDPYQVNSANSGPYGDAVVNELIPFLEKMYRGIGDGHSRVLSGVSTGGWVSLALQVYYPDAFNGVWSSCPDGVDLRAFQLINIYEDENAYLNKYGFERPSERDVNGEIRLTTRREVAIENLLGAGNSWTMSGGQWGAWNATYGLRGADGKPVPLWDPQTGIINHAVAEQWKKYDLRMVLEENWATLGPKLKGKIHIAVGDADNFYLNNAVHLLDEFLSHADPPYGGRIAYGPGKGHGWSDVNTSQMLKEMGAAMGTVK